MILYKRNAKGKPIFWEAKARYDKIIVHHGIVGKSGIYDNIVDDGKKQSRLASLINEKRKQGYKSLSELKDNAPTIIDEPNVLYAYLVENLPKNNTTNSGFVLPMLAKTLDDGKCFDKSNMIGQWKINGLRCLIGAERNELDMFNPIKLTYTSREGTKWNLSWMDDVILPKLNSNLIEMMIEEDVHLDGELYLPGATVNQINSFVKNPSLPQHYKLQYWWYDITLESPYYLRTLYRKNHNDSVKTFNTIDKTIHLTNTEQFVLLPDYEVISFYDANTLRDEFINAGFEGLILRDLDKDYQFGRRNSAMFKYKKIYDGWFNIIDIIPEGKRQNLPKFVLQNDINSEQFICNINAPQSEQVKYLINKDEFIGGKAFVEYRERSGINQVPFHARVITVKI